MTPLHRPGKMELVEEPNPGLYRIRRLSRQQNVTMTHALPWEKQ